MAIYATFEKLHYYKLWFQVHICEWMNLLQNEISLRLRKLRDDTHMTSMKTVKFLRHPTPSVHLCPKCFHTLDFGRPILNEPPTLFQQTMEQQSHRSCERTKSKQYQVSHSNWPRVLLFDSAHKQSNGIIKGWLQCLTPVVIGRFLVNNIITFDSLNMMSGHCANPIFFNKKRLDV